MLFCCAKVITIFCFYVLHMIKTLIVEWPGTRYLMVKIPNLYIGTRMYAVYFRNPSTLRLPRYTLVSFTYVEPTSLLFVHMYFKWSKRQSSTYHICVLVCLGEIQPGAKDLDIQVHMHLKWP